jgi:hypothetical protein
MKSFIQQNAATIYSKYAVPINIATASELVKYFGLLPGMATVLFDGVTVNKKGGVANSSSSCEFVHEDDLLS